MANSDKFTATTDWQFVEANGVDIEAGTFTMFSKSKNKVEFIQRDTIPAANEVGDADINEQRQTIKLTLTGSDKMACRSTSGDTTFSIFTA